MTRRFVLCVIAAIAVAAAGAGGTEDPMERHMKDKRERLVQRKAMRKGKPLRPRTPAEWAATGGDDYWKVVEEDWEDGDAAADVLSEDQLEYQRIETRKNAPADPDDFDMSDPSAWLAQGMATSGPTMMFARLRTNTLKGIANGNVGGKWGKEDTQMKAGMWKELLFTGRVEVTAYDIEWDTVLMTLQRGWNAMQLKNFLLKQPEVWQVTWNQQKFTPDGIAPPPEPPSPKKKKKKMKKKKKKKKKKKRMDTTGRSEADVEMKTKKTKPKTKTKTRKKTRKKRKGGKRKKKSTTAKAEL